MNVRRGDPPGPSASVVCPKCGCLDVAYVDRGRSIRGRVLRRFECLNDRCGWTWRGYMRPDEPKPDPDVAWAYGPPAKCPQCRKRGMVASTRSGFRYVRCSSCSDQRWKETGTAVRVKVKP